MNRQRKVIITGGSSGIGAACVKKFAEAGDLVLFIYSKNDAGAEEISKITHARHIKCDLSDYNIYSCIIRDAIDSLGGCDVLVNNAGAAHIGLLQDMSYGEIDRLISTDMSAAIKLTKDAVPFMIERHSGVVVNVGSVWGEYGSSCEAVYSAAKSGLRGFTKAMAKELGPSGIRVNCVEPGVIDTGMNSGLDDDVISGLCDSTPLGRMGTPEEVAEAVFFLASDKASFITGAVIPVNGGFPS